MNTVVTKIGRRLSFIAVFIFTVFAGGARLAVASDLDSLHDDIERQHENVSHIKADAFQQLNANDILIFDIREKKEFAVSHLKGAIQVDPDEDSSTFLEKYGRDLKGKTVVVYCSVGVRSTEFLSKVQDALEVGGASASYNLEGGIFRWHNEHRALQQNGRATLLVHPFSWYWSRLLDDKDAISYMP